MARPIRNMRVIEMRGRSTEAEIVWAGVNGLYHANVPHRERGLAVRKIVVPLANESVVKSESPDAIELAAKRLAPEPERARVGVPDED